MSPNPRASFGFSKPWRAVNLHGGGQRIISHQSGHGGVSYAHMEERKQTYFVNPLPSSRMTIQHPGSKRSSCSKSLTYSNLLFAILHITCIKKRIDQLRRQAMMSVRRCQRTSTSRGGDRFHICSFDGSLDYSYMSAYTPAKKRPFYEGGVASPSRSSLKKCIKEKIKIETKTDPYCIHTHQCQCNCIRITLRNRTRYS